MAGITGLGTTYNLPNYTGILYGLTPTDTPFFSAIGHLSGGGQSTSKDFEWETFDLRAAAQPANLEGAAAPTAQERVRANVTNLTQIHQEKVSVSYTKIAAVGQHNGVNNEADNPVRSELDWQVAQMLTQMVRDVEYSFINGTYQAPVDNSTGRKTRGLIAACTSNVSTVVQTNSNYGTAAALPTVTATAASDLVNSTAHGLNNGDTVIFTALTGGAGLAVDTAYYVINKTANTFQVSLAKNGAAIDITTDASAATAYKGTALTTGLVDDLLQSVYDNGGIMIQDTATLIVNSAQKRRLTAAYGNLYGKYQESSRNVGGLNLTTIETDFGTLNIMVNRFVPQHKLIVCSLEQCQPVYLEVPGKGHFFAEPLAKTGASDDVQLYGEVGLAYGNEKAHGYVAGLAL